MNGVTVPEPNQAPRGNQEAHIADTGMFRRFVAEEEQLQARSGSRTWLWVVIGILVVAVAGVVVWLVVR